MSKNKIFTGPLSTYMEGLLEEKHSLGYKYAEQERLLKALDRMSVKFDCSHGLPKDLCMEFIKREPNWHQTTQEQRVALLHVLAEYMLRHDVPAYVIDSTIVTKLYEDFKPYIFSHKEVSDIFATADRIQPNSVNSHVFYPVLLRVQYGCGLRISETLGLKMKDVDFTEQVLHVTNAKNHKDRDVPVSNSVMEYMDWYRRKIHPVYRDGDYFFRSRWGDGHYDKSAVNHYFRDILFRCGINHGGRKNGGPHLHNLRHTFCVHSLEMMLKNGIPHQTALPLLMTYMGHASLSATGKYLKLTAEAFPELTEQINGIYGEIMPSLEVKMDYEEDE